MDPLITAIVISAVLVCGVWMFAVVRRRSRRPGYVDARTGSSTRTRASEGLRSRLDSTRQAFSDRLGSMFGATVVDAGFWEDLEASLVAADMGVPTASAVVALARGEGPRDGREARRAVAEALLELLEGRDRALRLDGEPSVVLVVGVNGSGKTTSIAKLAAAATRRGDAVVLAAADTYRAAAHQQLEVWAERAGADVVTGRQGSDPAAVAYEALQQAQAKRADLLIVDTAGRLQTKQNLMDELGKMRRVLTRDGAGISETLLVVDGTTGQNALSQARRFAESVDVTGIVITKLDGTARGGMVIAIERELGIPVKLIGVGEHMDDLVPFEPEAFVDALMGE